MATNRDRNSGPLVYPVNKNDKDGIMKFAEETRMIGQNYREELERSAMGNILTYIGMHWIRYDSATRLWRPMILRRKTPRPFTNKFDTVLQQQIANIQPGITHDVLYL